MEQIFNKYDDYIIRTQYKTYELLSVRLDDNFVGFLYSQIQVTKNGSLIDQIENVSRSSIIKECISYSLYGIRSTMISGFESRFEGGGNFEAMVKLSNLCLGFFQDIRYPIFKGGIDRRKIHFKRANNNDPLYMWGSKPEDIPGVGKVNILDFKIKVPLVEY